MRRGLRRHKASNILDKRPRKLTGLSEDQERKREEERTKTRKEFIGHLNTPDTRMRPYLAIACRQRARLQPRLYRLADITRQVASRQTRERVAHINQDLSDVFEIRVRTIMAGFLEEWIRYNPTAKTQTVLRYHRNTWT
jgi:hypothetical protein